MTDSLIIVTSKSPKYEETAKVFQKVLDHWIGSPDGQKAMEDAVHDFFGIPREGREPDYLNGRWCIKCDNSLPDDWQGPCDVCGYAPTPISLDGLLAREPCKSAVVYEGIPRAENSPAKP